MAAPVTEASTEASALLDFILSLPGEEYDKGLARYDAVQTLLLTLLNRNEWPEQPAEFKTLLAPIVCASAEQQQDFHRRFDAWARQRARVAGARWLPPPPPPDPLTAPSGEKLRKRLTVGVPVAAVLIVALTFGWFKWHSEPANRGQGTTTKSGSSTPVTGGTSGAVSSGVARMVDVQAHFFIAGSGNLPRNVAGAAILANGQTWVADDNGRAVVSLPFGFHTRYLVTQNNYKPVLGDYPGGGPLEIPLEQTRSPEQSGTTPAPPQAKAWYVRDRNLIRGALAGLPFAVLACLWGWTRFRRLALRKWEAAPSMSPLRLSGRSAIADIVPKALVREIAREMCRRIPRPSRNLAAAQTANLTAKNEGYFSPVYAEVRAAQEYVVLIERAGPRDQQAQFATALVSLLSSRGAFLTAYYYTGDPRICTEVRPPGHTMTLEEVIARHPGHVLWVMGNAGIFADPVTGEAPLWASGMSVWQRRIIFDSGGPEILRSVPLASGFQVLPLDPAAIRATVSVTTEDGEEGAVPATGGALPDLLTADLRSLFAAEAPSSDDTAMLLRAIRQFLGREAYDCFCACALLPQLSFHVTLSLVRKLVDDESRYEAMQRMVRTPWMRFGVMPEWLRKRLIRRLPADLMPRALATLKAYLESAVPTTSPAERARGWIDVSRPSSRGGQVGAMKDFIYLGALWGLRQDELAIPSPGPLSRLLFRNGYAMFGVQLWVHLGVACLLSAALWLGSTKATEPPRVVQIATEDPFLRRVREVAQSQLGKSAEQSLWRSPFADWAVDQAAQLLETATPLLSPSFDAKGSPFVSAPSFLAVAAVKPAWISIAPRNRVRAENGSVQGEKTEFGTERYIDIRPSSQLSRKIAVISTSAKVSFTEVQRFAAAVQQVVNGDLRKYWGVNATIGAYRQAADAPADAWQVTVQDKVDSPGAASFHSETNSVPFAQVGADVPTSWTLFASHEIFEMLVDPFGARYIRGPAIYSGDKDDGTGREVLRLAEICDPVSYVANKKVVDGIVISDFVFPRWFYDQAGLPGEPYDSNRFVAGPREIRPGGYSSYLDVADDHVHQRTFFDGKEANRDLGVYTGFEDVRKLESGLKPTGWDAGTPDSAWCYQERKAEGVFGAYCHWSRENCETARGAQATACAYVTGIRKTAFRPAPKGILDSWWETPMRNLLPPPFPQFGPSSGGFPPPAVANPIATKPIRTPIGTKPIVDFAVEYPAGRADPWRSILQRNGYPLGEVETEAANHMDDKSHIYADEADTQYAQEIARLLQLNVAPVSEASQNHRISIYISPYGEQPKANSAATK